MLRSLEVDPQSEPLKAAQSWIVPIRQYEPTDDWMSKDGNIKGSHDEAGRVRPEYVAATPVYDESGVLIEGVLDPDCIEARGWTLSAPQYKPFDFAQLRSEKSVVELIQELQANQRLIGSGLDKLLAMAEGRE